MIEIPPQSLATFQREFGRYMRDPHHVKRPLGVPKRAGDIYHNLLFSNFKEFLNTCFPICQTVISTTRWNRLCRVYFRDWEAHSPIFSDIPAEFINFLNEGNHSQPLPMWFNELAHYEWVELYVDTYDADFDSFNLDDDFLSSLSAEDIPKLLENKQLSINPTLQNLHYRWPVHKIGSEFKTRKTEETFILVYRDDEEGVRFMHINAMTGVLLDFLQEKIDNKTINIHFLTDFAMHIGYADMEQIQTFGCQLLLDLLQKQVLFISK